MHHLCLILMKSIFYTFILSCFLGIVPLAAEISDPLMRDIISAYEKSVEKGYDIPSAITSFNSDSLFLRYAQQGFNTNAGELYYYYEDILNRKSWEEVEKEISRINELSLRHGSNFLRYEYEFARTKNLATSNRSEAGYKLNLLQTGATNARKRNDLILAFRYQGEITRISNYYFSNDVIREIEKQSINFAKELEGISPEVYPLKKMSYYAAGERLSPLNAHENGIKLLKKAIAEPTRYYFDRSGLRAMEILGIHYRLKNELKKSDAYFLDMLKSSDRVVDREIYDAVALCNLGINYIEKGDIEKALRLFLIAPCLKDKKDDIHFVNRNYLDLRTLSVFQEYAEKYNRYSSYDKNDSQPEFDSEKFFEQYASEGLVKNADNILFYYGRYLKNLREEAKNGELKKMLSVANRLKSRTLYNEAEFLQVMILPEESDDDIFRKATEIQKMIDKAEAKKNAAMKLRGMRAMFDLYSNQVLSYRNPNKEFKEQIELARNFISDKALKTFTSAYLLSQELEKNGSEQYPFKRNDYYAIGKAYAFFSDTERMLPNLEKALSEESSTLYFDQSNLLSRILLGRYYCSIEQFDKAATYFRSVIESRDSVEARISLNAIALSGLTIEFGERIKNYGAVPLAKLAYHTLGKQNQYSLLVDLFSSLGWSYLNLGEFDKSKSMLDSVLYYENMLDPFLHEDRFLRYYNYLFKIKYYIEMEESIFIPFSVYFDNMQNKFYEEVISPLIIRSAEQDVFEAEDAIKNMRIKSQQGLLIIGFIFLLLFILFFSFIFYLYKKNKIVYKALVIKSQEWADRKSFRANNETPNEDDIRLVAEIESFIQKDQLYKNPDLTLDTLARKMDKNRNYLSKAINSTTGYNFTAWLNEFKVKEAIKIMSDSKSISYSIEAIGEMAGFGGRSTFYNVFKKSTGLSPADFRKNMLS